MHNGLRSYQLEAHQSKSRQPPFSSAFVLRGTIQSRITAADFYEPDPVYDVYVDTL